MVDIQAYGLEGFEDEEEANLKRDALELKDEHWTYIVEKIRE